jgi:ATP-binding cassette subfamily B protein
MNEFEEQEYSSQLDVAIWKKILYFCKPYKKNFALLIGTGLVLAITDAMFPQFTGYAIDHFVVAEDLTHLSVFIILYVILILLKCLSVFLFVDLAGKIETDISHDVRKTGYEKLMGLSFSYFDNTPVGWIMARLTSDTYKIGSIMAWSCLDLVWSFSIIIFSVGFMFFTDFRLTLLLLLVAPFMVLVSVFFQKRILAGHRESRKINSKITASFNEGISGAKTTKTLIRERKNYDEFQILSGDMRRASIRALTIASLYFPIIMSLANIGVAIVLGEGGRSVIQHYISLGAFTIFISYASLLNEPISNIARTLSNMKESQASAERTIALIEREPDIIDSQEIVDLYGDFMNPKPEGVRMPR